MVLFQSEYFIRLLIIRTKQKTFEYFDCYFFKYF